MNVVLHERWKPSGVSGYGERCLYKGIVVYRIGGATMETRYYIHKECVELHTTSHGEKRKYAAVGEVGFNYSGETPPLEFVEKFIEEKLIPAVCMVVDGD